MTRLQWFPPDDEWPFPDAQDEGIVFDLDPEGNPVIGGRATDFDAFLAGFVTDPRPLLTDPWWR